MDALARLRSLAEALADGESAVLSRATLLELLRAIEGQGREPAAPAAVQSPAAATWKERLWIAPPETRIGVAELCEALGRPRSWVYRHTSPKAAKAAGHGVLPHRKLDGELLFAVGEVRAWIQAHEDVVHAARPGSPRAA